MTGNQLCVFLASPPDHVWHLAVSCGLLPPQPLVTLCMESILGQLKIRRKNMSRGAAFPTTAQPGLRSDCATAQADQSSLYT